MSNEATGAITRKELVEVLHDLGLNEIKERTLEDWQAKGLLPQFDARGRGLGKGKGRSESSWSNSDLIIRRAICVHNLLRVCHSAEKAYVPLIMRGHTIPIASLRDALTKLVIEGLDEVSENAEKFGNLED